MGARSTMLVKYVSGKNWKVVRKVNGDPLRAMKRVFCAIYHQPASEVSIRPDPGGYYTVGLFNYDNYIVDGKAMVFKVE